MESMTAFVVFVIVTALTTAAMTTAFVAIMLRRISALRIDVAGDEIARKVRVAVEGAIEEALPSLRNEVAGGLEDAGNELLPRVRSEVENGVRDAAKDVLPDLRDQVREGFSEAMASAVTGGILSKAGDELVRKGSGVLDLILGTKDDRDEP